MSSPFLEIPASAHVASNALAFAVRDKYPVAVGHTLVVPRRLVATWFEATPEEREAIFALVDLVKAQLDEELKPDGYNVGFNAGEAAGQTVMHLHVHVIPRYRGDMDDPRGGVRHVIPSEGNYLRKVAPLSTGGNDDPFARHIFPWLRRAREVAIVAAFVQESGLDRIHEPLKDALANGAVVRLLTGDYLGITQAAALETLLDWQGARSSPDDDEATEATEATEAPREGRLAVRVVETQRLAGRARSFHPKSWRFEGERFGVAYVGSSNLSWAALGSGIEWNLRVDRDRDRDAYRRVREAFDELWGGALPLTREWVEAYARRARERPHALPPGELLEDELPSLPPAHEEQLAALAKLRASREAGRERAMLVFATGLGKTLVSVLDYAQLWDESGRPHPPRLLFLAHRRELLLQAARAFRQLLRERQVAATVGWFAEASDELHADLVFASVAKLARAAHLAKLREQRFDYVVVDEVHHAAAASYRTILDALEPGFTLGLTATPERADGADVVGLFDDHVAHRAGIAEGIRLSPPRLVPFHYFGVKDTIDYATIPWRNRRFDPDELTRAAETEARMASLWRAWQAHPGARTILFCCSITHASFVKAWLAARGVTVRAIHSGPSADDRTDALKELADGVVDAVCAVDVLNEGVDVPAVDRVVMLRPTESNVVFLQQLGRGLRAHEGKSALTVIDFVGNHRLFLERLRALLSLGAGRGARDLKRIVERDEGLDLPEGCRVELELEAKELLSRLFRSDGADEVERAYREIAASRDQRPRAGELLRMGYSVRKLRERHGSWFDFVKGEGDLSLEEREALEAAGAFLRDLETTPMTKCFKMVTLLALIEHDALATGLPLDELAQRCHRILLRDPALLADVPEADRGREPSPGWAAYWQKNPIAAWTRPKARGRAWFAVDAERFVPRWGADDATSAMTARMVAELVDLRLAEYRRRLDARDARESFSARLTWNQRDPILKLPSRRTAQLPEGETDVRLEDGSVWVFRFMREYCNVARPAGADRNQLPDLLRRWFGPSAGQPGTAMQVRFEAGPDGWTVVPETVAQVVAFPRRAIAAYPDLRAAAGHSTSASLAPEASEVELPTDLADRDTVFAVRVAGSSMDGGRRPLRSGDWAVFRVARGVSASSIENRVALVQVPAETDALGYQIKRIKRRDGGWVLASDHPDGPTIPADDSMVVVAKLEESFAPEQLAPDRGATLDAAALADAFGISVIETEDGRYGGHLFVFVTEKGRLASPSHVKAHSTPRPAETAYVLARVDGDRWRYLGVGRWDDATARWQIPEVDLATWKAYGEGGGVSRPLPEGARSRAGQVVDALLGRPVAERWIEQASGRAEVLGAASRGGLRIAGSDGGFAERTVSLTDLAWVGVALDHVREHGGRLDEARVNRLRYLEGTPKGSTRYIDTGWAIAAWERAAPWLTEASGRVRVHDDEGAPIGAHFEVERRDGQLSLVFHSGGGTRGGAAERNSDYAKGLERLLARLAALHIDILDALVDSERVRDLPDDDRRIGEGAQYPLRITDPIETRLMLGRGMAEVGRGPGAKGGGNRNEQIRLVLGSDRAPGELARILSGASS